MSTYKVRDLEGALLDAAVAKAETDAWLQAGSPLPEWWDAFNLDYSTNWAHGGPIIERERIDLMAWNKREDGVWFTCLGFMRDAPGWEADGGNNMKGEGPTPLIAAMRAFVVSRFGDEVEI